MEIIASTKPEDNRPQFIYAIKDDKLILLIPQYKEYCYYIINTNGNLKQYSGFQGSDPRINMCSIPLVGYTWEGILSMAQDKPFFIRKTTLNHIWDEHLSNIILLYKVYRRLQKINNVMGRNLN